MRIAGTVFLISLVETCPPSPPSFSEGELIPGTRPRSNSQKTFSDPGASRGTSNSCGSDGRSSTRPRTPDRSSSSSSFETTPARRSISSSFPSGVSCPAWRSLTKTDAS